MEYRTYNISTQPKCKNPNVYKNNVQKLVLRKMGSLPTRQLVCTYINK